MRIEVQGQPFEKITSKLNNTKINKINEPIDSEQKGQDSEQMKLHQAVDTLNEFFEIDNKNLKFIFHEGLEKYYVQLVDSKTEEVVKEIPSKKLLDAFYEMQKLVGMIIDEKR